MNYFQGGDLGAVLGFQVLQESVVKVYAAEIALALGELHRRNFIYRDLKPQNILIH
jgi:serine/threonine protein kinase